MIHNTSSCVSPTITHNTSSCVSPTITHNTKFVHVEDSCMFKTVRARPLFTSIKDATDYMNMFKDNGKIYEYRYTFDINDTNMPSHHIIKEFHCDQELSCIINDYEFDITYYGFTLPTFLLWNMKYIIHKKKTHFSNKCIEPLMITATFVILPDDLVTFYKTTNCFVVCNDFLIKNGMGCRKTESTLRDITYV